MLKNNAFTSIMVFARKKKKYAHLWCGIIFDHTTLKRKKSKLWLEVYYFCEPFTVIVSVCMNDKEIYKRSKCSQLQERSSLFTGRKGWTIWEQRIWYYFHNRFWYFFIQMVNPLFLLLLSIHKQVIQI